MFICGAPTRANATNGSVGIPAEVRVIRVVTGKLQTGGGTNGSQTANDGSSQVGGSANASDRDDSSDQDNSSDQDSSSDRGSSSSSHHGRDVVFGGK